MGEGIITGPLAGSTLHFASPIQIEEPGAAKGDGSSEAEGDGAKPTAAGKARAADRTVEVLLRSSEDAWLETSPSVQPDFRLYPGSGFGRPKEVPEGKRGPHVLAVALTGRFDSAFAGAADKAAGEKAAVEGAEEAADAGKDGEDKDERWIQQSPPDARVVVVGSSSFVSDELLQLSDRARSEFALNNLELVHNMVDWAVADTDLLTIRSRGSHTRLLEIDPDERSKWEWTNYGIMGFGLILIIVLTVLRQRGQLPIELDPRPGTTKLEDDGDEADEADDGDGDGDDDADDGDGDDDADDGADDAAEADEAAGDDSGEESAEDKR
jgi:ABC-2 type transport system permease protein